MQQQWISLWTMILLLQSLGHAAIRALQTCHESRLMRGLTKAARPRYGRETPHRIASVEAVHMLKCTTYQCDGVGLAQLQQMCPVAHSPRMAFLEQPWSSCQHAGTMSPTCQCSRRRPQPKRAIKAHITTREVISSPPPQKQYKRKPRLAHQKDLPA